MSKKSSTSSSAAEIIASNVDLLTEILLRVSAKSLIKFKSVSKQWLSLISDSRFGRNHTHQNPSPPLSGLYFYSEERHPIRLVDQITRFSVHNHPPTTLPNLSFLDASGSRSVKWVFHSANGLTLCSNFDTSYVISNPTSQELCRDTSYVIFNLTTQKFVLLSTPVVSESFGKVGSYLVFDPKKSPYYKVLVVSFSYVLNTYQFDVYSSETASWKSPILTPNIHSPSAAHGAVWNGEMILMSCSDMKSCIRFDIDAEKLTTTRLLYSNCRLRRWILYFGECSGHLLLIQRYPWKFEVLEMVKEENNFRWTVKCTVDLSSFQVVGRRSICRFSVISVINVGANEDDLAVLLYIRGAVRQYDIKRNTLKVLSVLCEKGYHYYSFQFIESLMPV